MSPLFGSCCVYNQTQHATFLFAPLFLFVKKKREKYEFFVKIKFLLDEMPCFVYDR